MRISFIRVPRGECIARMFRRDGVVVELPSYTRKWRLPHDIAHFVTERELHLATGIFGSLAAGATFSNVRLVSGQPRPDAAARSKRILAANRLSLTVSDVLSGVLHETIESDRPEPPYPRAIEAWSVLEQRRFPWTVDDIDRATATLRSFDERWAEVGEGQELEEFWPDVLTSPIPPPRS